MKTLLLVLMAAIALLASGFVAAAPDLPEKSMNPVVSPKLAGPDQARQFDFLVGAWDVAARRFNPDGSTLDYQAKWTARHLAGGRIVLDEFASLAPDGQVQFTYVTLRTYVPAAARWEMAGLAALQPAAPANWHGEWKNGEMQLEATGAGPQGKPMRTRIRFFDIAADRFSWESRVSLDEGASWLLAATLRATRAAP